MSKQNDPGDILCIAMASAFLLAILGAGIIVPACVIVITLWLIGVA